ncbi:MAG: hypothetical protein GX573_25625, partial [Chloroflexi bacterium]|nr:hypothetical protein [Chloroflexota bacterium]
MAQLESLVRGACAVKTLDEGGRVGGYLVVWGHPAQRDLHGEYFTPDTDLGLDWYPRRPVLYHHGLDGELGPVMIGQIERMQPDSAGVWVEAQLDLRNRWARAVLALVQRDALGWSSGSLPHLVDVAADGHIRRWPIVEGSLTPTPAEPRLTDAVAVKAAFEALGLPTDRIDDSEVSGGMMNTQRASVGHNDGHHDGIKRLPATQVAPRPGAPAIEVSSKYAHLDAVDMAFMHTWLSRTGQWQPSSAFMRELAHKAFRAVEQGD